MGHLYLSRKTRTQGPMILFSFLFSSTRSLHLEGELQLKQFWGHSEQLPPTKFPTTVASSSSSPRLKMLVRCVWKCCRNLRFATFAKYISVSGSIVSFCGIPLLRNMHHGSDGHLSQMWNIPAWDRCPWDKSLWDDKHHHRGSSHFDLKIHEGVRMYRIKPSASVLR